MDRRRETWGGRQCEKCVIFIFVFVFRESRNQMCVPWGGSGGLNWGGEAVLAFLSICQAFFQKICQRRKGN